MAHTISVEEKLPHGAAGVLINGTHTYREIYLPIDPQEKLLFEAIDGRRSLIEIASGVLPAGQDASRLDLTRALFEKLWWHDQVVFDASRQPEVIKT